MRDYPSQRQGLEKGVAENSSQSVIYRHIFGTYPFFCAELLAYGRRLVYNIGIDERGVGALDLRAALLQIVEVASEG
ncbi:MAG TPA: hypothetical protein PLK53_05640, partial [Bacillota bacterium]|nr:hypothetical protein [Bacillota bacterium]